MVLTGRGGYGNYKPSPKIAAKDAPDSPELAALKSVPMVPTPVQHYTSPNQTFSAGRGGYGNHHPVSELRTVTPSEYLKELHDATHSEPARYTVGRGGRGNIVKSKHPNEAQKVVASHSHDHALTAVFSTPVFSRKSHEFRKSGEESDDGFWHKLKTTMSH